MSPMKYICAIIMLPMWANSIFLISIIWESKPNQER